mgnify:CR=1 FL=1
MPRRWYCSTSVWLAINTVALVAASSFFLEFTPTGLDIRAQTVRYDRIDALDKLDHYVSAGETTGNTILLLGSSLGLVAANLADYKSFGLPRPDSQSFLTYNRFRYLDNLLNAGQKEAPLQTLCLTQGGNMVFEDLLLLRATLKAGIHPRLVIYLASPRDFLDRLHAPYLQSKLAKTISSRLNDGWNFKRAPRENLENYAEQMVPAFMLRSEIIKYASGSKSKANKSMSAGEHFKGIKDEPGAPGTSLDEQMRADYEKRYLPIDWSRVKQEKQSLEEISAICKENHIPLLVVAMPLSRQNLALLPPEFLEKYRQMLGSTSTSNFLDLTDDSQFEPQDFLDAVHLRSSGGIKLAKKLQTRLAEVNF